MWANPYLSYSDKYLTLSLHLAEKYLLIIFDGILRKLKLLAYPFFNLAYLNTVLLFSM